MTSKRTNKTKIQATAEPQQDSKLTDQGLPSSNRVNWRPLFVIALVFAGILVATSLWLYQPTRVKVNGTLKTIGYVETTFFTRPNDGKSLGCGCKELADNARGIGIFADNLEISTGTEKGGFTFIAKEPNDLSIMPSLSFEGTIYQFEIDSPVINSSPQILHRPVPYGKNTFFATFSPKRLVSGDIPKQKLIAKHVFRNAYILHLIGSPNLNIAQCGVFPFITWNPTRGSNVKLAFDKGQGLTSLTEQVKEQAVRVPKEIRDNGKLQVERAEFYKDEEIIHPIVDFIGVPIVLWTDQDVSILLDSNVFQPAKKDVTKKALTVIVLKAAFSIRMIPLSSYILPTNDDWLVYMFDQEEPFQFQVEEEYTPSKKELREASKFIGNDLFRDQVKVKRGSFAKQEYLMFSRIPPKTDAPSTDRGKSKEVVVRKNMPWLIYGPDFRLHAHESADYAESLSWRFLNINHLIAKRNSTTYTINASIDHETINKLETAQKLGLQNTALGSYRYLGDKWQTEFVYPKLESNTIMFKGNSPSYYLHDAEGQLLVASELINLPGGNNLSLSLENGSQLSGFNYNGGTKLDAFAYPVSIDDKIIRNYHRYKEKIKIMIGILTFLLGAKVADLLGAFRGIRDFFKNRKDKK